jgi:hypothetical protein
MVAVRKRQVRTAIRFPKRRPTRRSKALTPQAMKSGPIINSVPAVCSPAYIPQKARCPRRAFSGTGVLSNSSDMDIFSKVVG